MAEVFLVMESGGSYDSYYEKVILVFSTREEADQAVLEINKEMEALKALPSSREYARDESDRQPGEGHGDYYDRRLNEHDAMVVKLCQVYPAQRDDGLVDSPDFNDGVIEFDVAVFQVSVLADLLKSG